MDAPPHQLLSLSKREFKLSSKANSSCMLERSRANLVLSSPSSSEIQLSPHQEIYPTQHLTRFFSKCTNIMIIQGKDKKKEIKPVGRWPFRPSPSCKLLAPSIYTGKKYYWTFEKARPRRRREKKKLLRVSLIWKPLRMFQVPSDADGVLEEPSN